MLNTRSVLIGLLLALLFLAAVPVSGQTGARADCGPLKVGVYERPRSLAPQEILTSVEKQMGALVYETVYRLNKDNVPEAVLALYVDGSLSDDGKHCLLQSRSGSQWTTFDTITRGDIVFSFQVNMQLDDLHRAGTAALAGAEEVGEDQIALTFSSGQNPSSIKRILTRIPIISKEIFQGDFEAQRFDSSIRYVPTGSGWYTPSGVGIEDFSRGSESSCSFMRADQRDQHFSPLEHPGEPSILPAFPQVMYVGYSTPSQALDALRNGAINFMPDLPISVLTRNLPGIRVESVPRGKRWSLIFNLTPEGHEAIREVGVREALCLAIDRRRHMTQLLGYNESNVDRFILSGPFLYHEYLADQDAKPRPYDPEAALVKLRANSQLWNELKSTPLRLVYTGGQNTSSFLRQLPPRIGSDLEKVGVSVQLISKGMRDYLQYLRDNKDWDLALVEWDSDQSGGIQVASLFGSPYQENSMNFGHYVNDQMDGLIASILGEARSGDIGAYTKRAHKIVYEELPHIFLWEVKTTVGYDDNLVIHRKHRDNYLGQMDTWECMQEN